jgi:hypothetical protein
MSSEQYLRNENFRAAMEELADRATTHTSNLTAFAGVILYDDGEHLEVQPCAWPGAAATSKFSGHLLTAYLLATGLGGVIERLTEDEKGILETLCAIENDEDADNLVELLEGKATFGGSGSGGGLVH